MLELRKGPAEHRAPDRPRLWALWSAALTPVVLVGGWVIAGAVQPTGYDPLQETISVLSGDGAAHRWIMTLALFLVAAGYFVTAAGLRPVHPAARTLLVAASIAGFGVALFPQPPGGSTFDHMAFAVAGAALLLVWPFMMAFTRPSVPFPWGAGQSTSIWEQVLSRQGTITVGVVVAGAVLAMFVCAQLGSYLGVAERVCTFVQSLPPLLFAFGLRSATPPRPAPAAATLGDAPPEAAVPGDAAFGDAARETTESGDAALGHAERGDTALGHAGLGDAAFGSAPVDRTSAGETPAGDGAADRTTGGN